MSIESAAVVARGDGEGGEGKESIWEQLTSCRWLLCYAACLTRLAQALLRKFMGIAIICMSVRAQTCSTDGSDALSGVNTTGNVTAVTYANGSQVVSSRKEEDECSAKEFHWHSGFEGLVLASFNMGFAFSPAISGHLVAIFGEKTLLSTSMAVAGIVTMVTPPATRLHPILTVVLRIVVGVFSGVVEPIHVSLWSKWAPLPEVATLASVATSGIYIAGMFTFPISASLCTIPLDHGWPFVFYVVGGATLLFLVPWQFLVFESPEQHPRISEKELLLIRASGTRCGKREKMKIPWLSILTSAPVYAIFVCNVINSWVTTFAMTYLPSYMRDVLHYDIEENGLLSSLPYLGQLLAIVLGGCLSARLMQRRLLSTLNSRRLFQLLGNLGCACAFGVMGYLDSEQRYLAVVLQIVGLSFRSLSYLAYRVNILDIAPRFAALLSGLSSSLALFVSWSAPLVTSALVKQGLQEEWQRVFWVLVGLNVTGAATYLLLASADLQPWALGPLGDMDTPHPGNQQQQAESSDCSEDKALLLSGHVRK